MTRVLKQFYADAAGATAIEYALIAVVVGLGIIVGLQGLPVAFNGLMNNVTSNLDVS